MYDVVTVLRCLYLRDTNPQAWADLLTLQESNPKELNEELADRAKKVTGFICGTLKLGNTFTKELVFDICTRLDVNSFEIPLGRTSATVQVNERGIYVKSNLPVSSNWLHRKRKQWLFYHLLGIRSNAK